MQTINNYIIENDIQLQIAGSALLKTGDRTVYARPLKLYKGVDNTFKLRFRNQDQKMVSLTTPAAAQTTSTFTGSTDGATGNNAATITPVPLGADIVVSASVDNETPYIGDSVVFTIEALNSGPGPAANVAVNDLLPSGYTYVSAVASTGAYSPITGDWEIGLLSPVVPQAATGATGATGAAGQDGYTGYTGYTGLTGGLGGPGGPGGAPGASGSTGVQGPTGPDGPMGVSGFSGATFATLEITALVNPTGSYANVATLKAINENPTASQYTVYVKLFEPNTQIEVFSKTADVDLTTAGKGIATITITATESNNLISKYYDLAVILIDAGLNKTAAYSDDNYGVRIGLEVFGGPVAAPIEAEDILPLLFVSGETWVSNPINVVDLHTSSTNFTFQVVYDDALDPDDITITVQGTTIQSSPTEPDWIDLAQIVYTNLVLTEYINVVGQYTYLRVKVVTGVGGDVGKITELLFSY